jgi:putative two-component system response regulator
MFANSLQRARILIVKSDPKPFEEAFRRAGVGFVRSINDLSILRTAYDRLHPDIILVDSTVANGAGIKILRQLRGAALEANHVAILSLVGDGAKDKMIALGADGVITEPVTFKDLLSYIKPLVETRLVYVELLKTKRVLMGKVREYQQELHDARLEALTRLSLAAELRDNETGRHNSRVARMSQLMAEAIGCSPSTVEALGPAAALHDIGKIGIPDSILLKPGKLSPDEFEVMMTHTTIGGVILSGSDSPLLRMAADVARTHHENWDGSGYPSGLKRIAIPLVGRIVAVADVFDALTHARPYKPAWSRLDALQEIRRQSGLKFDPRIAHVFRRIVEAGFLKTNMHATHPRRSVGLDETLSDGLTHALTATSSAN